jgi:DNA-binding LytR/AlgR family response regulator
MNKIRCLITDDEPLAIKVLENYISNLDYLELAGHCENAVETINFLQKTKVDLLFLDIQMPGLTGIDFLRTLRKPVKVILTTAYRDYALEGYDLNVLDYLLKPVSFERFLVAVNKYYTVRHHDQLPSLISANGNEQRQDRFIYLKAEKKMIKVFLRDILFIEGLKDYVRVKTTCQEIITYQKLSYLEEKLPDDHFLRIHRSFIVSIDKITSFNMVSVDIGPDTLPIGRWYKEGVMSILGIDKFS